MPDKIFLHLFILTSVEFGLTESLAPLQMKKLLIDVKKCYTERLIHQIPVEESSDFRVRRKRVVSLLSNEDIATKISEAPHVVIIKEQQKIVCAGNIISLYVVISAASCFTLDQHNYKVLSSSSRSSRGDPHYLVDIRKEFGAHPQRNLDGIALLTVHPPFMVSSTCKPIKLHSEPLLPGAVGNVSGWGFKFRSANRGTNLQVSLRTIQVPIIRHQDCVNRYQPHIQITLKEVCTYHQDRHCGHNDMGAGLVLREQLVGIFLWSGLIGQIDFNYPDVFVVLQDSNIPNGSEPTLKTFIHATGTVIFNHFRSIQFNKVYTRLKVI